MKLLIKFSKTSIAGLLIVTFSTLQAWFPPMPCPPDLHEKFYSCKQDCSTLTLIVKDEKGQFTPTLNAINNTELIDQTPGNWGCGENNPFGVVEVDHVYFPTAEWKKDPRAWRHQWDGTRPFHNSGQFNISLEQGTYQIKVGKGVEYIPVDTSIQLLGSSNVTVEISLKRFDNLLLKGWWPGDTHVHVARPDRSVDSLIFDVASAEGIHIINNLWAGREYDISFEQFAFGEEGMASRGEQYIVVGQEAPRTEIFGHSVILNTSEFLHDPGNYYLFSSTFNQAKSGKQLSLSGYKHHFINKFCCNQLLGPTLAAADGNLDVVEIADPSIYEWWNEVQGWYKNLNPIYYYEWLNMGLRPSLIAGSDYQGGGAHIGDNRVYVKVDPDKPMPDAWFEGLKAGRVWFTQGPLLEFTINGQEIGSDIRVAKGAKIQIESRSYGHPKIGSPANLAIIIFGDSVTGVESTNPQQEELKLSLERTVNESQWIAIRSQAHNGSWAHSAPIYIIVDGQPAVAKNKIEALKTSRINIIKEARLNVDLDIPANQRQEYLAQLDRAELFYKSLPDNLMGTHLFNTQPKNLNRNIIGSYKSYSLERIYSSQKFQNKLSIYNLIGAYLGKNPGYKTSRSGYNNKNIESGIYIIKEHK